MAGRALDMRVETIVSAISRFWVEHKRVPREIAELREFCEKHKIRLFDLNRLSAVEFENGRFSYSAHYGEGSLYLSHLPGRYLTSAMLESPNAEQPGAAQPATQPEDKPPVKDQPPTPTSKDAPR